MLLTCIISKNPVFTNISRREEFEDTRPVVSQNEKRLSFLLKNKCLHGFFLYIWHTFFFLPITSFHLKIALCPCSLHTLLHTVQYFVIVVRPLLCFHNTCNYYPYCVVISTEKILWVYHYVNWYRKKNMECEPVRFYFYISKSLNNNVLCKCMKHKI